ncbi:MAG: hypothetical protein D6772_14555 [Bacteroidetes bacterium]|nr:MAG: hypothetical protein D6772_14555 [Bacteroidota bacterium]
MNQFTFEAKHRTVLGSFMILGALCLALTAMGDDDFLTRTWSNYLHNTVFFLGIAFVSLFVLTAFTTAYAGWHIQLQRIWESFSLVLIPMFVLMLVVVAGVVLDWNHLYHWAHEASVAADPILQHKSAFLNNAWYGLGTTLIVGVWIFFAVRLRNLSKQEDAEGTSEYKQYKKTKVLSAIFLPIAGFSSAAMIWQWVMSVDAHWYSTLYAWYCTASWFVAAMALTIMLLIWLKSRGYYEKVTAEHFHDLGKYLFAFSIFWTYLWFSQYMLIWYANNGEETTYFFTRINEYPALFYGNLLINFVLPFFVLMRNDTKRKVGTLFFVSLMVFLGHWFDYFQMVKPGVAHTAHEIHMMHEGHATDHSDAAHLTTSHADSHAEDAAQAHDSALATGEHHEGEHAAHGGDHGNAGHGSGFQMGFTFPGLLELGTMLGFLATFLYFALAALSKAKLVPQNHPFVHESEHHHV